MTDNSRPCRACKQRLNPSNDTMIRLRRRHPGDVGSTALWDLCERCYDEIDGLLELIARSHLNSTGPPPAQRELPLFVPLAEADYPPSLRNAMAKALQRVRERAAG